MITIDLGPLSSALSAELAAARARLPEPIVTWCVARAEGNPLFLEQLLLHATDQAADVTMVPSSIQAIVLARSDHLPARDRAALQAAAALGQSFDLPSLRHVAGDKGYQPDVLIGRHLLRPEGTGLRFAHALIRDGIYAAILSGPRQELHQRAASWFAGVDPVATARHLDRAGDPGAATAYLAAGEALLARFQPVAARPLLERGRAIATARPERARLGRCLAQALLDLGEAAAARVAWQEALAEAEDEEGRCRALIGMASALRMLDAIDEAFSRLAEAAAVAVAGRLPILLAEIHHLWGNLHFPRGETAACREAHEAALSAAEAAGSAEWAARALGGLGDADYGLGRLRSAATNLQRAVTVGGKRGLLRIEAACRPMLAVIRAMDSPPLSAREEAERALACTMAIGYHRGEIVARHAAYMAASWSLDLDEAESHVRRAQALTRQIGARRFEAENLAFLAEIAHRRGDPAAARVLLDEAWDISRRTGVSFVGPVVLGVIALSESDAARRDWAIAEGARLMTGSRVLVHNALWYYGGVIEAALAAKDAAGARDAARCLAETFAAEPVLVSGFLVRRARLLAAAIDGPADHEAVANLAAEGRAPGYRAFLAALDALSPG